MIENIKIEKQIQEDANAMRKLVEYAKVGLEVENIVKLEWLFGKPKRKRR